MPRSCYNCDKEMETTKQCANCQHAAYCSKDCQKKHWSKHKPNCIRSDHSIHGLFRLCFEDLLPSDVCCLEMGESHLVFSSIGASRKMIVEALENNKLDDLIHLFIKNVFSRHGPGSPHYCFGWIWNRMVIGPTRTEGLTRQQIQEMR
ncbi:unnamed protein product, partial [Porites lobata]